MREDKAGETGGFPGIRFMAVLIEAGKGKTMEAVGEKIYKTMSRSGVTMLITGIVMIAAGVALGTLAIVSGSNLLRRKSKVLF